MLKAADKYKALNLLALRKAARGKAGGKGQRLRKPPRILFPAGAERSYRKSLLNIVRDLGAVVEERLIPELPRVLADAQARRPTADNADVRVDRYDDAVAHLLELVRSEFFGQYTDAAIAELVRRMTSAVEEQNGREVGKVFKDVLGVDLFGSEPWLGQEMSAATEANVALIKSLADRYLGQVEALVYDGARSGRSWQELARDLRGAPFRATRRQAELIARDQVGKFNGQLAQLRQMQAGVSRYTWRDSHDARVRHRHHELDGQVFRWDDPPVVDKRTGRRGHPGSDYRCRCYAEPLLEDLLDGGDEDDGE